MISFKALTHYTLGFVAVLSVAVYPLQAYAYVGPAIAFVSYLFGPVVAVVAVIGLVLYLPIKAILKKRRASKAGKSEDVSKTEAADDTP